MSPRLLAALAAGLIVAAGISSAPEVEAKRRARVEPESVRVAKRISVDDRGIEITHVDRVVREDARGGTVEIGPDGVHIAGTTDSLEFRTEGDDAPGFRVEVDNAGLVRVFSDAEVPAGDRVEGDVVAVFGSVTVAGEVTGDVVAVFGSIRLEPGASAGGDVVAVGGVLDQAPGATVKGESVSLSFIPVQWGAPGLQALLGMVLFCWLLTLLMGWLLHLIFPTRMLRIAVTASRRPAASLFLGLSSAPLVVITIVLLLITVIGIPFALVLPIVYVFSVWAGQIAVTYLLGCRLTRRAPGLARPFGAIAAGATFVALFFVLGALLAGPAGAMRTMALFFVLFGALLVVGLSALGVGSVLLSGFGSRPRDLEAAAATPGASGSQPAAPIATAAPIAPLPEV